MFRIFWRFVLFRKRINDPESHGLSGEGTKDEARARRASRFWVRWQWERNIFPQMPICLDEEVESSLGLKVEEWNTFSCVNFICRASLLALYVTMRHYQSTITHFSVLTQQPTPQCVSPRNQDHFYSINANECRVWELLMSLESESFIMMGPGCLYMFQLLLFDQLCK